MTLTVRKVNVPLVYRSCFCYWDPSVSLGILTTDSFSR